MHKVFKVDIEVQKDEGDTSRKEMTFEVPSHWSSAEIEGYACNCLVEACETATGQVADDESVSYTLRRNASGKLIVRTIK